MRPYSFSKPKIRRLRGLGCNMRVQTEYQPAPPSSTEGHDPPMKRDYQSYRKTMLVRWNIWGQHVWHNRRTFPQDAQKAAGLTRPTPAHRDAPFRGQGSSERLQMVLSELARVRYSKMARMSPSLRASNEGLLRPRVARARGTHRAIPPPAGGLFQHPAKRRGAVWYRQAIDDGTFCRRGCGPKLPPPGSPARASGSQFVRVRRY
jgi:hypothetical protein